MLKKYVLGVLFIFTTLTFAKNSTVIPVDVNDSIVREIDDMTDDIKISSPVSKTMAILKRIKTDGTSYYFMLSTTGVTGINNSKGVIVLFDDNTRMTLPDEEITLNTEIDGFRYFAVIKLTKEDLIILATKKIKKYRLHIFDQTITPEEGNLFANYVNYVMVAK